MQKRGGGRFGKYGDLKRKEKIRQTRVLKQEACPKPSGQGSVLSDQKKGHLFKPNSSVGVIMGEAPGLDPKRKTKDLKK
jgi:hypothetical protein